MHAEVSSFQVLLFYTVYRKETTEYDIVYSSTETKITNSN